MTSGLAIEVNGSRRTETKTNGLRPILPCTACTAALYCWSVIPGVRLGMFGTIYVPEREAFSLIAWSTASSLVKLRRGSPGHGISIQAIALQTNRMIAPRIEPNASGLAIDRSSFD